MIRRLLYLAILLSLPPLFGDTVTVDVETAVEMASSNNLGLQSEEIGLDMKKRHADWAYSYFYPRISGTATLSRMHEPPPDFAGLAPALEYFVLDPDTLLPGPPEIVGTGTYTVVPFKEELEHTWNISFGFQASFTLTAQMIYMVRQATLDYEAGLIGLETAKRRLERDVRKAFFRLLLLRENIENMEQTIAAAEDRYAQARSNYDNGLVPEYTMLSAQVAMENLKPPLEDMVIGYRTALLAFKQLIGVERDRDIELRGSVEMQPLSFELEELFAGSIDRRGDIRSLKKGIENLENLREMSRSELYPSLTLFFSLDPTFMGDPFRDKWFEDTDENWTQRGGMFSVSVSVPLDPLLPSSQSRGRIADQEEMIRQTQIRLAQARQGAELEIESLLLGLRKSLKSIDNLRLNVDLAQRAYNLAEEAYSAGGKELLEVQNAELELRKARLEVLQEQYNYTVGLLDLEYAINTPLNEAGELR